MPFPGMCDVHKGYREPGEPPLYAVTVPLAVRISFSLPGGGLFFALILSALSCTSRHFRTSIHKAQCAKLSP